jgi:hypothetical protein
MEDQMDSSVPDFFLSSGGENNDLNTPRICRFITRLIGPTGNEHMLVKISPPVIGQRYGMGNKNIEEIILSPRHVDSSLFPINAWPIHVYVSRLLTPDVLTKKSFTMNQIEMFAWAALFQTLDEARKYAA